MLTRDKFVNGWNTFVVRTLIEDVWVTKTHHAVSDLVKDLSNIRKHVAYGDTVLSDEKIYLFTEDDAEPILVHVVRSEDAFAGCTEYNLCVGSEIFDTFYITYDLNV